MPKFISIENKIRKIEGPLRIKFCDTFFTQLRGFTFHAPLARDEGLILVGTQDFAFGVFHSYVFRVI